MKKEYFLVEIETEGDDPAQELYHALENTSMNPSTDMVSFNNMDITGETADSLIALIKDNGIERVKIAKLYRSLSDEEPLEDSEIDIKCRKCKGKYIKEKHELIDAYGYFYHKRCVE